VKRNSKPKQSGPTRLTDQHSPTTNHPTSALDWSADGEGNMVLIAHLPGHVHMFPMGQEYAERLQARYESIRRVLATTPAQEAPPDADAT